MTEDRPPRLEDVARLAGVSTATVSRAMNDPDKVAQATRDQIDQAIETLGYTPNFSGRLLASSRATTVAAIIPTLSNAMFASGVQAFQEALSEAGITLLIGTTNYDSTTEMNQIRAAMANGAGGFLLIGKDRPAETRAFLKKRNMPYVIGWSYDDDPAQVFAGFDNAAAAFHATKQVMARGHRRIGMIAGQTDRNDRARDRLQGVRDAAGHCLIAVEQVAYRLEFGGAALARMMGRSDPPTAILCGNDVLAAGAMVRAREMGVRVPQDLSIVGFDDIGLATVVTPPLTTVRVPQIEMGHAAAQLLLAMLAGDGPVKSVKLHTEWIERGSLAARTPAA